jgi:hypothetical protein
VNYELLLYEKGLQTTQLTELDCFVVPIPNDPSHLRLVARYQADTIAVTTLDDKTEMIASSKLLQMLEPHWLVH